MDSFTLRSMPLVFFLKSTEVPYLSLQQPTSIGIKQVVEVRSVVEKLLEFDLVSLLLLLLVCLQLIIANVRSLFKNVQVT